MSQTDARVDSYIDDAPDYAKPILKHLRQLIHKVCPSAQEAIKWGHPFYDYNGSVLCATSAFKNQCKLMFWKARFMKDPEGILHLPEKHTGGSIEHITSLKDLPPDKILTAYIKEAMLLSEVAANLKQPEKVRPNKVATKKSIATSGANKVKHRQ